MRLPMRYYKLHATNEVTDMKITLHTDPPIPANEYHGIIKRATIATYHIDFADVDNWLRDEATDEQRDEHCWPDETDLQQDYTRCCFTEASPIVHSMIADFGLRLNLIGDNKNPGLTITCYWENDKRMFWVLHQFEGISAVTNLVNMSYEHTAPDVNGWGSVLTDLSGDDDVDYSGSYIMIGTDLIVDYLKAKVDSVVPT